MKFKINAGTVIDAATPDEVKDAVHGAQQSWFQEMARGLKHMRFETQAAVATGETLTIDNPAQPCGPEQGFAWAVQRVSVEGLTGSDTLQVFRSPLPGAPGVPTGRLYGVISPTQNLHVGSRGIVLHGGERLAVSGTGLSTTVGTIVVVSGEVVEVPEFMIWKLL